MDITTTCPNSWCGYKHADLHNEKEDEVIIYCQSCGYEGRHKRRNSYRAETSLPPPEYRPAVKKKRKGKKR